MQNVARVRSLTFNIRGLTQDDAERIVAEIVSKDPDVVLFHEVDTDKQRSGLGRIDHIRRRVDEETRKLRGCCPASDVVFGAEVRHFANAILTRNGFTVAAGEEVESVPERRERNGGRLRLSEVPPVLVVMVRAPNGQTFSIVSTNQSADTTVAQPQRLSVLTRLAREQSRFSEKPTEVLVDTPREGLAAVTLS